MGHSALVVVAVVVAVAVGTIGLVEEVEGTIVVVVIMVQEVVVATAEVMGITALVVVVVVLVEEEEGIIVMVVAVVVLTTTVLAVVTVEETKITIKGEIKIPLVTVAMDRRPLKVLHPMAGLQVTMHRPQVPMEATMCTARILQCLPLIAMEVVEDLTHQAMVPHLQTHIVVVHLGVQEACRLHMMVGMVVGLCLGVEAQVVHRHLIKVAAAVVTATMLPLNQLRRLSSVMQTVMIPVTIQGYTYQTCLLM